MVASTRMTLLQSFYCIVQEEVDQLPSILLSISEAEIVSMQHALSHVWHRFAYTSLPLWQKVSP